MQIAAAKIAVDLESDTEGQLTQQQLRSYQASMRHEHRIYEHLQACHASSNGIPAVYFAGKSLVCLGAECCQLKQLGSQHMVSSRASTHPGMSGQIALRL